MAYTINGHIADISDITIKAYPDRMGRNQIKAFERYVRTGVIAVAYSAPATLARAVRRYLGLPVLHLNKREISWERMNGAPAATQEAFFTGVNTALCAYQLEDVDNATRKYDADRIAAARDAVQIRCHTHSFWLGWDRDVTPFKLLLKDVKLGEYTGPMPTAVFLNADTITAAGLSYEQEELK